MSVGQHGICAWAQVARNGKGFEVRILASAEGQSAKFSFMRPHDPYNAYYEHKIREFEEGGGGTKPEGAAGGDAAPSNGAETAAPTDASAGGGEGGEGSSVTARKAVLIAPIARAAQNAPKEAPLKQGRGAPEHQRSINGDESESQPAGPAAASTGGNGR